MISRTFCASLRTWRAHSVTAAKPARQESPKPACPRGGVHRQGQSSCALQVRRQDLDCRHTTSLQRWLVFPAPATDRRHVGLGPGLVDEHQRLDIERWLILLPPLAPPGDIRSLLFDGVNGFFEAQTLAVHEGPHGLVVDLEPPIRQFISKTLDGKISAPDTLNKPVPPRASNLGLTIAAKLRRRRRSGLRMAVQLPDDRRGAKPKPPRHLVAALTRQHKLHRTLTQFHPVRLRHSCWPPIQFLT